jgi:hypothetical protein
MILEKYLMPENGAKTLAKNFQSRTKYKGYLNLGIIGKLVAKIRPIEWFYKLHKRKL